MGRKVIYWVVTGLLGAMAAFAGFAYLSAVHKPCRYLIMTDILNH
jgi:hypothetical protein